MNRIATAAAVLSIGALTLAPAHADVIISEIMYNPDSPEAPPCMTEWVEVYNAGEEDADVTGWMLSDEDGSTGPIPEGTVLKPGEAVVLIPAECEVEAFREAWGEGFQVVPLTGWGRGGLSQLANGPSEENEVLRLTDAEGAVIDEVNYDDEGDWPSDSPDGPSIYLKPGFLTATDNDAGANWARSTADVDGARTNTQTETIPGEDVGSPGHVALEPTTAEPSDESSEED